MEDKYYENIKEYLIDNEVYKKVKDYSKNKHDLSTYYNVGKELYEAGKHYGEGIIKKYAIKLTNELGKGYTQTNLKYYRQFYLFSNSHTLCDELSWSHYRTLLSIKSFDMVSYLFNCFIFCFAINYINEVRNMNKKKYMWVLLLIPIILLIVLSFVISNDEEDDMLNYSIYLDGEEKAYQIEGKKYIEVEKETNLVKIDVKGYGIMIAELYPKIAPITVKNFKKLISEKFYDGLTFHRVIANFMIQTGDPTATGTGGSDEEIKGEFSLNGVKNDLSHERGVLSMARRGANPDTEETMNSASSQFFIVHKDSDFLDGNYAAFGKLIHGYDVLDKVASVSTDENDKPLKTQVINSIRFVDNYKVIEVDY